MTLTDAGVLLALVHPKEGERSKRCRTLAKRKENARLVTTWACFCEAMYLAYQVGGWPMQRLLWKLVHAGGVQFHHPSQDEQIRMADLMEQYQDTPMDLADATLVSAAETLGLKRIFTLDSDFHVYRIHGKTPFEVIS